MATLQTHREGPSRTNGRPASFISELLQQEQQRLQKETARFANVHNATRSTPKRQQAFRAVQISAAKVVKLRREALASDDNFWLTIESEGMEPLRVQLQQFLSDNADAAMDLSEIEQAKALAPGQSIWMGGGACPDFKVTRDLLPITGPDGLVAF